MGQSFWEMYWRHGTKQATRKDYAKGRVVHEDLRQALWPRETHSIITAVDRMEQVRAAWTSMFDKTYRVLINLDTGKVEVVCLGISNVDHEAEGIYQKVEELPMWMQEKLAVLNMMEVNPPQEEVDGVGIRIDESTYWVIEG